MRVWPSRLTDWDPPAPRFADDAPVAVRADFSEVDLRQRVKQAGGKRNPDRNVWELRSRWKPGSWTSGYLILDAVANPKGIYMERRRRPRHLDACIQHRILASDARCSSQRSNYSSPQRDNDERTYVLSQL